MRYIEEIREWNLETMIYTFLRLEYAIGSTGHFSQRSKMTQCELKRLEYVLNEFTDGEYNVETYEGREEIEDAFYNGFGLGKKFCTREQINKLKELLPPQKYNFLRLRDIRPRVGQFYEPLFRMVKAGYKYMSLFDDMNCVSDAFRIIKFYKDNEIDKDISNVNVTLIEAMKIVLGEEFTKVVVYD